MKSIEENADEYCQKNIYYSKSEESIARLAYIEGSRSVLSEIENLLDNVKLYSDLSSSTIFYRKAKELVEQLNMNI